MKKSLKKTFVFLCLPLAFLLSRAVRDLPAAEEITKQESAKPKATSPTNPTDLATTEDFLPDCQPDYEIHPIHPIAGDLFSGSFEALTFDDIIKSISDGGMAAASFDMGITDAKISAGGDFYTVYFNPDREVRISPFDTFMRILNSCPYIEIPPLGEPLRYTFVFNAKDRNGDINEIAVYITRSCVSFAYNGVACGAEYINIRCGKIRVWRELQKRFRRV